MDTSKLAHPKPRPRKLEKADRRKARVSVDDRESAKVKARSGGQCEVRCVDGRPYRCPRRAIHVHHRLGGIGVRGHGDSAKAENKLHVCDRCHRDMHAHVLVPDGKQFRRMR